MSFVPQGVGRKSAGKEDANGVMGRYDFFLATATRQLGLGVTRQQGRDELCFVSSLILFLYPNSLKFATRHAISRQSTCNNLYSVSTEDD